MQDFSVERFEVMLRISPNHFSFDGHADLIEFEDSDTSLSVMTADVSDLPLPDSSAGLVLALDVLEYVPDV